MGGIGEGGPIPELNYRFEYSRDELARHGLWLTSLLSGQPLS
jgi:hypothetical protein